MCKTCIHEYTYLFIQHVYRETVTVTRSREGDWWMKSRPHEYLKNCLHLYHWEIAIYNKEMKIDSWIPCTVGMYRRYGGQGAFKNDHHHSVEPVWVIIPCSHNLKTQKLEAAVNYFHRTMGLVPRSTQKQNPEESQHHLLWLCLPLNQRPVSPPLLMRSNPGGRQRKPWVLLHLSKGLLQLCQLPDSHSLSERIREEEEERDREKQKAEETEAETGTEGESLLTHLFEQT